MALWILKILPLPTNGYATIDLDSEINGDCSYTETDKNQK